MKLGDLKTGQKGKIVLSTPRLEEMGIIEDLEFMVVEQGGTIIIEFSKTRFAIRNSDVEVEKI